MSTISAAYGGADGEKVTNLGCSRSATLLEAIGSCTIPEARAFMIGTMRALGVEWDVIARMMRAPSSVVREDLESVRRGLGAEARGYARGERSGRAKLDNRSVLKIVERRKSGATMQEIADEFGVSDGNVSAILRGRNWSHVSGISQAPRRPSNAKPTGARPAPGVARRPGASAPADPDRRPPATRLEHAHVRGIVARCQSGEAVARVAARFGTTVRVVEDILHGRSWNAVTGLPRAGS